MLSLDAVPARKKTLETRTRCCGGVDVQPTPQRRLPSCLSVCPRPGSRLSVCLTTSYVSREAVELLWWTSQTSVGGAEGIDQMSLRFSNCL